MFFKSKALDKDLEFKAIYRQQEKIVQKWFLQLQFGQIFMRGLCECLSLQAAMFWFLALVLDLGSGEMGVPETPSLVLTLLLMTLASRSMLQGWVQQAHSPNLLTSELRLKSAREKESKAPFARYFLGYTSDKAQEVWIDQDEMMRHFLIAGMTGVGKTVASNLLMIQQMAKGGGLLWVDGKLDPQNMTLFFQMAKWLGRESDVRIINPANPTLSNTYNFVLDGSADEVASRILTTFGASTSSAGADYYKQAANQGLICILAVLKWLDLSYNCMDLAILLSHSKALENLQSRVQAQGHLGPEASAFLLFLETCRNTTRGGQQNEFDSKKLRDLFGGVAGRLFVFGSATCGEITGSYTPDINLYESICSNELIYCALPSMGQHVSAQNFGKMLTGDLRSAIAKVQALPLQDRPNPPFMVWLDEVASYASAAALGAPFQQARSARLSIGVGFQEHASMQELGSAFLGTIMGNTYSKLFFKPAELDTATVWSKMLGTQSVIASKHTRSVTRTRERGQFMSANSESMRLTEVQLSQESQAQCERVSVQQLFRLGEGHAVFLSGGTHLYDVKIPMVELSGDLQTALGGVKIHRPPKAAKHAQWIKIHAFNDHGAHTSNRLDGRVKGLFFQHVFRDFIHAVCFNEPWQTASAQARNKPLGEERSKRKYQNLAALHPQSSSVHVSSDLPEHTASEVEFEDE